MSGGLEDRIPTRRLGLGGSVIIAVVILLFVLAMQSASVAQTFTTIYNFEGPKGGGYSFGGLIEDNAGNLYGTTYYGGSSDLGTVFELSSSGTETVLHSFQVGPKDGQFPFTGLVRDSNGTIYGTTSEGGAHGYGVAFKIDSSGKETLLHSFAGDSFDGCYPLQGLVKDTKGNLFGTTQWCGAFNYGTVFKLTPRGEETILASFDLNDGAEPLYGHLLIDGRSNSHGDLLGVAPQGGDEGGVVYALKPAGTLTVVHNFKGVGTDGSYSYGTPAMDSSGTLYGTTMGGGSNGGFGTVWKVIGDSESLLYSFEGASDGCFPYAGVVRDSKGNLYGVTTSCGASNAGTIFQITPTGVFQVIHSFSGSDGAAPYGDLLLDASGTIYGTTSQGGTAGYGTVWSITP